MKRLAMLCGALLLFAGIASAQDISKVEVFGGYSYMHVSISGANPSETANLNGGSASIAYNAFPWLGVVADVGGYHGGTNGVDGNFYTYLFGPKIAYHHGSFTPFAQALFGGAHASAGNNFNDGASENSFAAAFGGGLDWNATSHIGIRLIQAEYLMTKFTDGINDRQNNARISTGVVFRF
jgi:opacity protein-like surface antigen